MEDVRLREMTADESASYRAGAVDGYVAAMMRDAGLSRDEARAKAAADFEAIWPGAEPPAGHTVAVVEADGVRVGVVWFGVRAERPTLFLYDVEIDEAHRGRGLGRAAMTLLEDEARRRGVAGIELNVFGGNERARRLYRSLGYDEVAVTMRKLL